MPERFMFIRRVAMKMRTLSTALLFFGYSSLLLAFWPNISLPPQSTKQEVVKDLRVNGLDMQLINFSSRLSERQVINYYRNKWANKFAESVSGPWQQISQMQDNYFITVQVQENNFAGSTGRISILSRAKKIPEVGKNIPMLDSSRVLNEVVSKDKLTKSTVVLLSNAYSADDNAAFYEKFYSGSGWKVMMNQNMQERGTSMVFKKERTEILITIKDVADGSTVVMNKVEQRGWFN